MTHFFLALCLAVSVFTVSSHADEKADKTFISNTLTEFATDLNNNDFKKLGSYFAYNAHFIDAWGKEAKNKETIEALFKANATNQYANVITRIYLDEIRFLSLDICIVDATMTFTKGLENETLQHALFLFIRQNKDWKIIDTRFYRYLEAQNSMQETSPSVNNTTSAKVSEKK